MTEFKEISPKTIHDNIFKLIDDDWMLISSGSKEKYNTMTASWGGLGILWFKNVSYVFVRPSRYSFDLMNAGTHYSLSFFDENYRNALAYCGKHSGRDGDKIKAAGLTPVFQKHSVFFEEARMVMICKKMYQQDIVPENFTDGIPDNAYPQNDYHRMYIGEITHVLVK